MAQPPALRVELSPQTLPPTSDGQTIPRRQSPRSSLAEQPLGGPLYLPMRETGRFDHIIVMSAGKPGAFGDRIDRKAAYSVTEGHRGSRKRQRFEDGRARQPN